MTVEELKNLINTWMGPMKGISTLQFAIHFA